MAEHIRDTARRRRNHRALRRKAYATFVTGLAIMVVLGTVMSLIQPAATLNADVLTCTQEEHTP